MSISLYHTCPSCRKHHVVLIQKNKLICQTPDCGFEVAYCCPICDQELEESLFQEHDKGGSFQCPSCQSDVPIQKIKYLIENGFIVDTKERCGFCNSPTIHRADINLGHRCFFFPKCSGQATLFGRIQESLVFLDFETTGLDVGKDALTEVGAIKIDEEGYEHTFQTFIKPPCEITAGITQLTGITNDMVASAPSLQEVMHELVHFIGNSKIVAHNTDFDLLWLVTSCLKSSISLPNNDVVCTLKWAKALQEPHSSLGALSKKYAIKHLNAHRALADAVVTKEIYFIFDSLKKAARPAMTVADYRGVSEKIIAK